MTIKRKKRKYTILNKIQLLPHEEYKIAKNRLPLVMRVSKRTFERWCYLKVCETPEIPADKLAIIAKFLQCPIEDLFNYEVPQYNISKLKAVSEFNLANDLKLVS